jgi:hypothetical protein
VQIGLDKIILETNFYMTNPPNRDGIVRTTRGMKTRRTPNHAAPQQGSKRYSSCLISSLPFLELSSRFSSSALRFFDAAAISASVRVSLTTGTP